MRNKKEEYNDFYGKNLLTYFRKHFENKNLYMALDERLGYAMRSLTQTTLEFEHIYNSLQFIKSQKMPGIDSPPSSKMTLTISHKK